MKAYQRVFRVENKGQLTRVFDAKTGEQLENIVRVEFTHGVKEGPKLLVTQADWDPEVTIEPDAQDAQHVPFKSPDPSSSDRTGNRPASPL